MVAVAIIATVTIIAGCQLFKKTPVVLPFTGLNQAYGVAVDDFGNVYVGGTTQSDNFPTKNAFQPHRAGYYDAFVTKFVL